MTTLTTEPPPTVANPWIDRGAAVVAVIAMILGSVVRIIEVAQNHAFGLDDTFLAINVAMRSFAALARPLAFEQSAPALFLWLDRLLVDIFGVNGVVLRVIPLIAGLGVPILTWLVGRRLAGPMPAALAAALVAMSPLMVAYSTSAKPYIVDTAIALILIRLSLRVLDRPERQRDWTMLAATGAAAILLSTPAVFTLATCATAITSAMPTGQRTRYGRQMLVICLIWAGVALLDYALVQRSVLRDPYLQRFWSHAFFQPGAPDVVQRIRDAVSSYTENLFSGSDPRPPTWTRITIAVLAVGGAAALARRTGAWAVALLVGPLLLAALASAVQAYPASDRTWLFASASAVLLVTGGIDVACAAVPLGLRVPAFLLAGLAVLTHPTVQSARVLQSAVAPDDLTAAIRAWRSSAAPADPIYIFARDAARWIYYTTDWRSPDTTRVRELMALAHIIGPNSGNAPGRGHPVRDEGDALVYAGPDRDELIGDPTGMEDGMLTRSQPAPDSGWADNEARRMAAAARRTTGCIWMLVRYAPPEIDSTVIAAAGTRGARTTPMRFGNVRLYRLQFDGPGR